MLRISIDPIAHIDYGLSYPVTYKFTVPVGSANLTVWQRKTVGGIWAQLQEKVATDFFNGIEVVRFDYTNDFAYVSVAFGPDSDDIYLLFKDINGNPVTASLVEICKYYDNRKAVVVVTADDWGQSQPEFPLALNAVRSRNIWLTLSIILNRPDEERWIAIQDALDSGYVEAANHSMTHKYFPYDPGDYDIEIGDSKQDLISKLYLPDIYRKGVTEYIWAWVEPGAQTDAATRAKLGQYKYLCDRAQAPYIFHDFTAWDAVNGLYDRVTVSVYLDSATEAEAKDSFDARYAAGEIYHLMFHPYAHDWSPGQKALNVLDYIKNMTDVWYVGFGALYAYHYVQERNKGMIRELASPVTSARLLTALKGGIR